MPRKQAVYGKKSRAACTTTNIFASPDNSKRKQLETIPILQDDGESRQEPNTAQELDAISPMRHRKALGEINGNAAVQAELPKEKKAKKPSKSKTKRSDGSKDKKKTGTSVISQRSGQDHEGIPLPESQKPSDEQELEDAQELGQPPSIRNDSAKSTSHSEEAERYETKASSQTTDDLTSAFAALTTTGQTTADYTTLEAPDCYSMHCESLLELTAYPVSSFSDWADGLQEDFSLVKIAEASFGEVYRLSLQPEAAADADLPLSRNDESVLKVIALTPPAETLPKGKRDRERALEKAENMSKPADVASELKLLQRLSDIPGFTNFRDLRVLKGSPPPPFASAFKAFNAAQKAAKKELSIFPDPAKKASYSPDQLWAVIEMQDAGTDLEKLVTQGVSSSIWVVWDVFWQVVLALAKGEGEAEFEHRDLHLGNICVRTPIADGKPLEDSTIDPSKTLGFTGFESTLIDYTISRASMVASSSDPTSPSPSNNPTNSQVAYIDLANDPHLFYGDSTEEYQYEIYRYMRGSIYHSTPYATFPGDPDPPSAEQMAALERSTARTWAQFHPLTNLCWLHYVLYMLLEQMAWPSSSRCPSKKSKPEAHARWKRARELEDALLAVQEALDPGVLGSEGSLGRAGELVAWAVEEGWLAVGDVVGEEGEFEVFEEEGDELVGKFEGLALQQEGPQDEVKQDSSEAKSKRRSRKAV
ncbi:hypothetical protein WHR41_06501 [Cladosporium halotolerans]|uniref:non-specific serine/threonine protein kinase n=1 Tax=Cladosporium halotolerans TaxID=1052096 RepID=A0AB34KN71_9PEZI